MEERGMLRSYMEALVRAREVSRERAGGVVARLATRGETRARDIQQLTRDLFQRSQRNRQELARLVQKEVQRQLRTEGDEPGASKP